jgi:UDP-2,3-diacylglucosamine pyrophosphatase LpxH
VRGVGENAAQASGRYRTVFISDVHLGSAASKAADCLAFLNAASFERLYLVGDFIDLWMSVKSGKWRPIHTDVLRKVADIQKSGIPVVYLAGNHDAFVRLVQPLRLGGLQLENEVVHDALDGRRVLVVHGDQQDASTKALWLSLSGAWSYEWLTQFSNAWDRRRVKKGRTPRQISQGIKRRMKRTLNRVNRFDDKLARAAQEKGCQMVICGHNHRPMLIRHRSGIEYANCGDWVENRTALVERLDGGWQLLDWPAIQALIEAASCPGSSDLPLALKVSE